MKCRERISFIQMENKDWEDWNSNLSELILQKNSGLEWRMTNKKKCLLSLFELFCLNEWNRGIDCMPNTSITDFVDVLYREWNTSSDKFKSKFKELKIIYDERYLVELCMD